MPKRKRDNDDKEGGTRKRQRVAKVDIVNPRHRSRIPTGALSERKSHMTKLTSVYTLNSLGSDIGGSTMYLQGWKVNNPWLSGGLQIPNWNTYDPVGFSDMKSNFDRYRVMGCKVDILWTPSAFAGSSSTYFDTGGQILVAQWQQGAVDSTALTEHTAFTFKDRKTIIDPRGVNQYHLAGTDAGASVSHFSARKYTMKMFRKPTMDLGPERMSDLRNDSTSGWLRATDYTTGDPADADKWGLRLDILPYTFGTLDKIYYYLRIRVKWYIEFVQGNMT